MIYSDDRMKFIIDYIFAYEQKIKVRNSNLYLLQYVVCKSLRLFYIKNTPLYNYSCCGVIQMY